MNDSGITVIFSRQRPLRPWDCCEHCDHDDVNPGPRENRHTDPCLLCQETSQYPMSDADRDQL
jgi:hypothetical protein